MSPDLIFDFASSIALRASFETFVVAISTPPSFKP